MLYLLHDRSVSPSFNPFSVFRLICNAQEHRDSRAGDRKQDCVDLIQMPSDENSAQVLALRRRRSRSNTVEEYSNTSDRTSSEYQINRELFTTNIDVQQLEARLGHIEDLLIKIAKSLNIKDGVIPKSQSTNDLFASTSYV